MNGNARKAGLDVGCGFVESAGRDVYGLVENASLPPDGGGQKDAGFGGGSGTEFEDGKGMATGSGFENVLGVRGEDGALGAGEVVLREGGDLFKEIGAASVVKEPGRESARGGEEAGAGLLGDGVPDCGLKRYLGLCLGRLGCS